MDEKVVKSDAEWRRELSPEQFEVTRKKPTGLRYCINSASLKFDKHKT